MAALPARAADKQSRTEGQCGGNYFQRSEGGLIENLPGGTEENRGNLKEDSFVLSEILTQQLRNAILERFLWTSLMTC
jgi:hypothetical protein